MPKSRKDPISVLAIDTIHLGDARDRLPQITPNSIALGCWSPPYHVGKAYEHGETYEDWQSLIREVVQLHAPILLPGGFLAVNIADILCFPDPSIPTFRAQTLHRQRADVTLESIRAVQAQFPTYRLRDIAKHLGCSEQTIERRLFGNNRREKKHQPQTRVHLVGGMIEAAARQVGLYLYDKRVWVKSPAWETSPWHATSYRSVNEVEDVYILWKPGATRVDRRRLTPSEWSAWGSRAVWSIPSVHTNSDHEAKFPIELPRRLIRLLTDPGDIVLDCFVGSGTTVQAAIREQRHFIGIEKNPRSVALARAAIAPQ